MLWGEKGAGRAGPTTSSSENPTCFYLACKSWLVLEHFFRSSYSFLKNPLWFYSGICKFYCWSLWPYTGSWYMQRFMPLGTTDVSFRSSGSCATRLLPSPFVDLDFSASVPLHTLLAVSAQLKGPGDTARLPGLGWSVIPL